MDANHVQHTPRSYYRWPFDKQIVVMPTDGPDGRPVGMVCSNLSAGGLRGLCTNFAREGLSVVAALPEFYGGVRGVRGKVVRCEPDRGGMFMWAVQFDEPIDPRRHVHAQLLTNEHIHEYVAPHMLRGRIAVISESAHDRALFSVTLRESPCVLTTHHSLEGVMFDARRLDVVVLSAEMQNPDISDALVSLVAAGSNANFVLIAADRTPRVHKLAALLPFRAALVRPCTPQMVLSSLAQALGVIGLPAASQDGADSAAADSAAA